MICDANRRTTWTASGVAVRFLAVSACPGRSRRADREGGRVTVRANLERGKKGGKPALDSPPHIVPCGRLHFTPEAEDWQQSPDSVWAGPT